MVGGGIKLVMMFYDVPCFSFSGSMSVRFIHSTIWKELLLFKKLGNFQLDQFDTMNLVEDLFDLGMTWLCFSWPFYPRWMIFFAPFH